jgi:hypothetical protein
MDNGLVNVLQKVLDTAKCEEFKYINWIVTNLLETEAEIIVQCLNSDTIGKKTALCEKKLNQVNTMYNFSRKVHLFIECSFLRALYLWHH